MKCALREFSEETKIESSEIEIVSPIIFTENFKGSNNKNYTTHYYLAETKKEQLPQPYSTEDCIRKKTLSEEASDIRWFSVEETSLLLNNKRQNIIKTILPIIEARRSREERVDV